MRIVLIFAMALSLMALFIAPVSATDLFQYDGWVRGGYNFGYDSDFIHMDAHDFTWARFNFYGSLTDYLSYYIRFQGIGLGTPDAEPFDLDPFWYYLSWKTPIGRFDLGRTGIMPTPNEEIICEGNGFIGSVLAFYPKLPQGYTGSLAVKYSSDGFLDGSHFAYIAQMDYRSEKWGLGFHYGNSKNPYPDPVDGPFLSSSYSVRFNYNLTPALSLNAEVGKDIEISEVIGPNRDNLALLGLRYMDPRWMVFAGYNFPRKHYAVDATYFINQTFALRTEYNNSWANYTPGFEISLYFMFSSAKSDGEAGS